METTLDRKDLKIQALLEKVSSLTTDYENKVADLRVELTIKEQEKQALAQEVHRLSAEAVSYHDVVDGEVLSVEEED